MKRVATVVLTSLLVAYLALCGLAFAFQRKLVFPAPMVAHEPGRPATLVRVPGGTAMAWISPPNDTAPVVVFFHGNGEQISDETWLGAQLLEAGLGFAAVEYPGYPLAAEQGPPSEDGIVAAAEKALTHLVSMGIAKERLVLAGQSIGTGVAVALAEKGWGTRVLLVSPYTSLPDVAARVLPFLPVRLLLRDRFNSLARAPRVTVPVLILHGTKDEVIPFDLGERLSKALPHARFVAVQGATHNTMWEARGVLSEATRFLGAP